MNSTANNIHPIREDVSAGSDNQAAGTATRDEVVRTRRDIGMVSLFISILAVLLLGVFYFGLSRNMTGLAEEVEALRGIDGRVAAVEEKMEALDSLPERTRRLMITNMVNEMEQRAGYLSEQLGESEEGAKLLEAAAMLKEVQDSLAEEQ